MGIEEFGEEFLTQGAAAALRRHEVKCRHEHFFLPPVLLQITTANSSSLPPPPATSMPSRQGLKDIASASVSSAGKMSSVASTIGCSANAAANAKQASKRSNDMGWEFGELIDS